MPRPFGGFGWKGGPSPFWCSICPAVPSVLRGNCYLIRVDFDRLVAFRLRITGQGPPHDQIKRVREGRRGGQDSRCLAGHRPILGRGRQDCNAQKSRERIPAVPTRGSRILLGVDSQAIQQAKAEMIARAQRVMRGMPSHRSRCSSPSAGAPVGSQAKTTRCVDSLRENRHERPA